MENINPLLLPLNILFKKLAILDGMLQTVENQLDNYKPYFKNFLGENNIPEDDVIAGYSLVIKDLTIRPVTRFAGFYPVGNFITTGEEYLKFSNNFLAHESAWTISQGYESFETYIKDLTACHLWINNTKADQEKLKITSGKPKIPSLDPKNIDYWNKSVRDARNKNSELLKNLRTLSNEIDDYEKQNVRKIDLSQWFNVLEKVRNATIHSNGIIKKDEYNKLTPEERLLFPRLFTGTVLNDGCHLNLNPVEVEDNLRLIAEYGYVIFKCLSKLNNYNWNIFGE
jgi:hypothetical protein